MIIERLRAVLARDEGCKLEVYELNGIPYIGYGVNLIAGLTDAQLEYLGVEDEDDIHTITQEQADWLLDSHIEEFTEVCEKVIGQPWGYLSDVRQEVLLNISLNVGENAFPKFRRMIAAVKSGEWQTASEQMLDSRAARQTGQRYSRLAKAFETDDEQYFEVSYSTKTEDVKKDLTNDIDPIDNDISRVIEQISILRKEVGEVNDKLGEVLKSVQVKKAPRSNGFFN